MSMNIIGHVESFLGEMSCGWITPAESENTFSIGKFYNKPVRGLNTYVTLGVSNHILKLPNQEKIRQELILTDLGQKTSDEAINLLFRMGDLLLTKHEPLLRGQVLGPGKEFFHNSRLNSIYVSMPFLFCDEFFSCKETTPETIFACLIPIFESEAEYVHKYGWKKFEDLLENVDPDLWDLQRECLL